MWPCADNPFLHILMVVRCGTPSTSLALPILKEKEESNAYTEVIQDCQNLVVPTNIIYARRLPHATHSARLLHSTAVAYIQYSNGVYNRHSRLVMAVTLTDTARSAVSSLGYSSLKPEQEVAILHFWKATMSYQLVMTRASAMLPFLMLLTS